MSSESDIRSRIRAIAGIDDLPTSILCTVVSVDEDEMTCEVITFAEDATYTDVRLMADPDDQDKGIYFKPKTGSIVMITPQDEVAYFVSMYSEVEEIWLHGNQYEGLVKVGELVTKLNNLENLVNSHIAIFNAHVHPYLNVAIPAFTSPSATPVPEVLIPTIQIEIENPKVLHG